MMYLHYVQCILVYYVTSKKSKLRTEDLLFSQINESYQQKIVTKREDLEESQEDVHQEWERFKKVIHSIRTSALETVGYMVKQRKK